MFLERITFLATLCLWTSAGVCSQDATFCFWNSSFLTTSSAMECSDSNEVIRLESLQIKHRSCDSTPDTDRSGCCRFKGSDFSSSRNVYQQYMLFLQRNCSERNSCNPATTLSLDEVLSINQTVNAKVEYNCEAPVSASEEIDPCINGSMTFNDDFYLRFRPDWHGDVKFKSCNCSIVSKDSTETTFTMIDLRLRPRDESCDNTRMVLKTSRTTKPFDCTSYNIMNKDIFRNSNRDVTLYLMMDRHETPEMIWAVIKVFEGTETVDVTCDAEAYVNPTTSTSTTTTTMTTTTMKTTETTLPPTTGVTTQSSVTTSSTRAAATPTAGRHQGEADSGGLPMSAKVAIPLMILVVAAIATVAGILIWRRRRQRRQKDDKNRLSTPDGGGDNVCARDNVRSAELNDYYEISDARLESTKNYDVIRTNDKCIHGNGVSKSAMDNSYSHLNNFNKGVAIDTYSHTRLEEVARTCAPEVVEEDTYDHLDGDGSPSGSRSAPREDDEEGYSRCNHAAIKQHNGGKPGEETPDDTYNHLHETLGDSYKHPDDTPDDTYNHPDDTPDYTYNHPNETPDDTYNHPNETPDDTYNHLHDTPDDAYSGRKDTPNDTYNRVQDTPDDTYNHLHETPATANDTKVEMNYSLAAPPGQADTGDDIYEFARELGDGSVDTETTEPGLGKGRTLDHNYFILEPISKQQAGD